MCGIKFTSPYPWNANTTGKQNPNKNKNGFINNIRPASNVINKK